MVGKVHCALLRNEYLWTGTHTHTHTHVPIYIYIYTVELYILSSTYDCTLYMKCQNSDIYIYIYIRCEFNKFPDFFFVLEFKIVVNSWKFSMLLLYILWDEWLIFMISGSNEQLQLELEYTLLKPDCHSWWILKMLSRREDT